MATYAQLQSQRLAAASDYATKAQAYVAAWVELQALDAVLQGLGIINGAGFGSQPVVPAHPVGLPDLTIGTLSDPAGQATKRQSQISAAATPT